MKTSVYKNILLVTIMIFVFLIVQPFAGAQKSTIIKGKKTIQQKTVDTKEKDKRKPGVQVVNNCGEKELKGNVCGRFIPLVPVD